MDQNTTVFYIAYDLLFAILVIAIGIRIIITAILFSVNPTSRTVALISMFILGAYIIANTIFGHL